MLLFIFNVFKQSYITVIVTKDNATSRKLKVRRCLKIETSVNNVYEYSVSIQNAVCRDFKILQLHISP